MWPPVPSISDNLRRVAAELGTRGEQWLTGLPSLVERVSHEWDLRVDAALNHQGHASVVYAVTSREYGAVILKLSLPHPEARWEAEALRHWGGSGAVHVLRVSHDGFTMLLERCRPGHDLWALGVEEQRDVAVEVLPRLWTKVDRGMPFPVLADAAVRWEALMRSRIEASGLPTVIAERATAWSRELRASQTLRLLHGDFHPGNVLAAEREPWLTIDPKCWVGDPAFDLAQWLLNRIIRSAPEEQSVALITDEARTLAERLDLDPVRILRWSVVKAIGWDFGRTATLLLFAAATVDARR